MLRRPPRYTLTAHCFPSTTLFRSRAECAEGSSGEGGPTVDGWALGECSSFRGGTFWEATGEVRLNGLVVRPRTSGAVVKVDTSSASLSADGGFDVLAILGEREIVLGSVSLSLGLSAEATGLSISDESLFGLPLAGSVTLVPNGLESVTVEAAVEVSPVLGGQTDKATFTVGAGGVVLESIDVKADKA